MENVVLDKSKVFAVRIVRLYQYLTSQKNEYIISKQLFRSGTGIGANITESRYAQSKPDFHSKMSIALKEAGETEYWLELLVETSYLTQEEFLSIISDCRDIIRLLISITRKTKRKP